MMLGGQADLVLKEVLAGWRDELMHLRQERVVERLREENLLMKAKSDESVRRTLSMMLGGQADLVLKEVMDHL